VILRKIAYMVRIRKYETTASYTRIIPGEIKVGEFYELIGKIASKIEVETILEIGSSSGEGSTRALLQAIGSDPLANKSVHCIEISKERYEILSDYLTVDARFHAHRLSSVLTSEFPLFEAIQEFHNSRNTKLSAIHLDTVCAWYQKDIEYILQNPGLLPKNKNGEITCGIEWIREQFGYASFDFVIIDGGEFTGLAELKKIIGAKFIALDDVNSFKCLEAHELLKRDSRYIQVSENLEERNGWSVYEMVGEK
jgi:hypothetical protein